MKRSDLCHVCQQKVEAFALFIHPDKLFHDACYRQELQRMKLDAIEDYQLTLFERKAA